MGGPEYRVTALPMGTLTVDSTVLVMGHGAGATIEIPVWAAAVEGNGLRILVDTGIRDIRWANDRVCPCRQAPDEALPAALAQIGWRCADVDIVINTHLHHDHVGFNDHFAGTRILVSADEWAAAHAPADEAQALLYEERAWLLPPLEEHSYELVTTDAYEVADGITLIQTPGHSAGHQSVLVRTAEGIVCVVGDAAGSAQNFAAAVPGMLHVSLSDAIASIERVRNSCDRVLMAHDDRIAKYQSAGFPPL